MVRVFRSTILPKDALGAVWAIGNFDGVHFGHQQLIMHTIQAAKEKGLPSAVLTFEPHPNSVLAAASSIRLTSMKQKIRKIAALGVDSILIHPFTKRFALLPPEAFIEDIIIDKLHAASVIVGHDFTFGYKKSGNIETLKQYQDQGFFTVEQLPPFQIDSMICSSSAIRAHLREGNIEAANKMLTTPWSLEGRVKAGKEIGRQLGFPTLNLSLRQYVIPKYGVYCAQVITAQGKRYNAVVNIGIRPTFNNKDGALLEAHILGHSVILYDQFIRVELLSFLRPEQSWPSQEALKEVISNDCKNAQMFFAKHIPLTS